ncbi:permease [Gudongella sp. DL1XJH-153]|uniref:permease n=1 Tax=Gudongella sp. DL1XJH-153 TaxID=3409804 RepID=UPI003BB50FF6
MKQSLTIVYSASIILMLVAYFIGGSSLVLKGLELSLGTALNSFLMILASFIIIGQLNVLLTKEAIENWLEKFSGIKSIVVSAIAGGLFPGGPYIYYPFIVSLKDKNLPFHIFISFIFGKQVYDFARLPMEISLVSLDIAIIRNLITLPIPIIVGLYFERRWRNGSNNINP